MKRKPLDTASRFDSDLDTQMSTLESEWRRAYEAAIAARAVYQGLATNPRVQAAQLDNARERLDRAEALKARVMVKIERLEDQLLSKE